MNIGARISKARRNAELTQQELADAVGITRQMLNRYESGQRIPRIDILKRIADHLKVTLDWFCEN